MEQNISLQIITLQFYSTPLSISNLTPLQYHHSMEENTINNHISELVVPTNMADVSCSQLTDNISTAMSEHSSDLAEDNAVDIPIGTQDTDVTAMSISHTIQSQPQSDNLTNIQKAVRRKDRHSQDKQWAQSVKYPDDI